MANHYHTGGSVGTVSWPIALAIVYGVFVIATALLSAFLAYRGGKPYYRVMPERHRNRRWVKPLLPVIFIIIPALLWPVVMIGVLVSVLCVITFDKGEGIWRRLRSRDKAQPEEVELGHVAGEGLSNEQSPAENTRPASLHTDNAATISEPPPAYRPFPLRIIPHEMAR
ncbi:hypothetical protein diail_1948 [Diaporthe ilicicola]|nr:hypothetical protein diail_1948 [Diaporthe ilicicola]